MREVVWSEGIGIGEEVGKREGWERKRGRERGEEAASA
jgi:hypothetical protein